MKIVMEFKEPKRVRTLTCHAKAALSGQLSCHAKAALSGQLSCHAKAALSGQLFKDPECWSGRGLNPRSPTQ